MKLVSLRKLIAVLFEEQLFGITRFNKLLLKNIRFQFVNWRYGPEHPEYHSVHYVGGFRKQTTDEWGLATTWRGLERPGEARGGMGKA
jgi:hypothetical protein